MPLAVEKVSFLQRSLRPSPPRLITSPVIPRENAKPGFISSKEGKMESLQPSQT